MKYTRKTQNISFKDMWHYLQRNNIRNNIFMLGTNNSSLVDFSLDKWSSFPRNTSDDYKFIESFKHKLINEIYDNIWFYFREIVLVPDKNKQNKFINFTLTPKTMMMIYLYINNKSYIINNIDDDVLITQYYLWVYNRQFKNNDMILTNNVNNTNDIIKKISCLILNSHSPVPFGINSMITDSIERCIFVNKETFIDSFNFDNYLNKKYKTSISNNEWISKNKVLFTLDDNNIDIYDKLSIPNSKYTLYLLGNNNINVKKADVSIYDKTVLEDIYLI